MERRTGNAQEKKRRREKKEAERVWRTLKEKIIKEKKRRRTQKRRRGEKIKAKAIKRRLYQSKPSSWQNLNMLVFNPVLLNA